MEFGHLKRRAIKVEDLYPDFKAIIDRTRSLNPLWGGLLNIVEDYWNHGEIALAGELLLDYVIEGDNLNDAYDIEIKHSIRMEMLISDVVKTLQILAYVRSERHNWQDLEVLFYE